MSAELRQAIADAASTVAGVKCAPRFTMVTKPGAACVRLDRTEYPNRLGGVDHWQVIVRLPADLAEAETFIDGAVEFPASSSREVARRLALYEAIGEQIVVTSVTPQQVVFDYGTPPLPCLIVAGHRAQEE